MASYIIEGGKGLTGDVRISGSKNAALPLLFASLTVEGVTILDNVPDIEDVRIAKRILEAFGARIKTLGSHLVIDATSLSYISPPECLTSKIRASSYLIGASLARFGRAALTGIGGCSFEARPIDLHIYAMNCLGARELSGELVAHSVGAAEIRFPKPSVGATINALIFASSIEGVTKIYGYAREPHVLSLVDFYRSAGIDIKVKRSHIEICGAKKHSAKARIIPDMIEAGTYIIASLLTNSPILIRGAALSELTALTSALECAGAEFYRARSGIIPHGKIKAQMHIKTAPYPAFATDLQPLTAPLLAANLGGDITETVWRSRFGYLSELSRFGVGYKMTESSRAEIFPTKLHAAEAECTDLRGGAALLLAAISVTGESIVKKAELIDRGYENAAGKLTALGVRIKREE